MSEGTDNNIFDSIATQSDLYPNSVKGSIHLPSDNGSVYYESETTASFVSGYNPFAIG